MPRTRSSTVFPTSHLVKQEILQFEKELKDLRKLHTFLARMEKLRAQAPSDREVVQEALEPAGASTDEG